MGFAFLQSAVVRFLFSFSLGHVKLLLITWAKMPNISLSFIEVVRQ